MLPSPINETEEQLIRIFHKNELSQELKIQLIQDLAYPDQSQDWAVGTPCAVCPPPHARKPFVENLIRSFEKRYTVTIFLALVGTPLNNDDGTPDTDKKTGERNTSAAGHMWYQISDMETENSFGFAPINSGPRGPGTVTDKDTIHYENPYYSRTLEITEEQYKNLYTYGESAIKKDNPDFDLFYNGITNSCINFTWKTLYSVGLGAGNSWNDGFINTTRKLMGNFEGDVRVSFNIPHVKSITPPFPNSNLNSEKYNERPKVHWSSNALIAQNYTLSDYDLS